MLYVTTRSKADTFTSQRALNESRGPDGGLYLPFHMPCFTEAQIADLADMPFSQRVAEIMNLLFRTNLTSWDVDFCVGRRPVRLVSLRQKIIMGECWHNPDWSFDSMVQTLARRVDGQAHAGSWVNIAVRIAVLFGIYGELNSGGVDCADLACVGGEMDTAMSAWYARQWGLPIGNIILCCNENKNLWDLICHGQMRTGTVSIPTIVPEADVVQPADLERLIYAGGGAEEVWRYVDCCREGGVYTLDEETLCKMRSGLYVSVVSNQRIANTIPGVYAAHGYIQTAESALVYAGLQDYRAKTGQNRSAVILAQTGPSRNAGVIAKALDISLEELQSRM